MSTLHMDVASVSSTQGNLMSVKEQLAQQVASMESAVNGMVGSTWIAPGATQFQSEFASWRGTMNQLLEQLGTLGQRLQSEVVEWEAAASKA